MSKHRKKRYIEASPVPKPDPQLPTTRGVADASQLGALQREWNEAFSIAQDRQSAYTDYDKMDTGYISSILNAVVITALTFGDNDSPTDDVLAISNAFKVQIGGYASAGPAQVMRQVIEDTNLRRLLRPVLREVLKYGDAFIEPLVDGNGNLARLFPHHVRDITVNRDKKGDLELGSRNGQPLAYQQRNDTGTIIAGWYPHEMIHVKFWPSETAYSEFSFISPYRNAWKRLDWIEQSMVVARVTRSFLRVIWKVDLTGKSVEEGRKLMRNFASAMTRRDTPSGTQNKTPLAPDEDYFLSRGYRTGPDNKMYESLTDAQIIDPRNEGLANIGDVKHFQNSLFDRVPAEMLGLPVQQNQDLSGQEVLFSSLIRNIQQEVLESQLVRPVFDIALRLKGYNPKSLKYKIVWPHPATSGNWKLADAQFRLTLAARGWLEMRGASRMFWLKRMFNLSDDQAAEVLNQVEDEEKRFGTLNPSDRTGQIAKGNMSADLGIKDFLVAEGD